MNRFLGLAGVIGAAALSTAAMAQQPLVQTNPNQHVIITQPVVVTSGQVVRPQVAATVPNEVAPPVDIATTAPQPAPYKPAPLGTYMKTTNGQRVVIQQTGYDMIEDVNGRRVNNVAMLTDGLGGGQIYPPGAPASFWPLQVGKSVTFNYGAGSPLSVTARVLRTETITVPAGTFYTYVIERRSHPMSSFTEAVTTFWYAPSVGTVVKEASYSPETGSRGSYEAVSVVLPHPLNGVPVTTPGDTAEKRANFCAQRGTTLAMPNGQSMAVPCVTYVQANLPAYQQWLNGEAASVPVTR